MKGRPKGRPVQNGESGNRTHDACLFRAPLLPLSYLALHAVEGIRTPTNWVEASRACPLNTTAAHAGRSPDRANFYSVTRNRPVVTRLRASTSYRRR